jgi:hypothetical protein
MLSFMALATNIDQYAQDRMLGQKQLGPGTQEQKA